MPKDSRKRAKDARRPSDDKYLDELLVIIAEAVKTTENSISTKPWKYCPVCSASLIRIRLVGIVCPECGSLEVLQPSQKIL